MKTLLHLMVIISPTSSFFNAQRKRILICMGHRYFRLSESKVDINDKEGRLPLHLACIRGHLKSKEQLLLHNQPTLDMTDHQGKTALHLACELVQVDKVELLLRQGADMNIKDEKGQTPLMIACENGQETLINLLLGASADANIPNNDGKTPLVAACEGARSNLALVPIVKLIASFPSTQLDARNKDDMTALHLACLNDQVEMAEIFLKQGASINIQDKESRTPLMIACKHGYQKLTKKLLKAGADANIPDKDGKSPIMVAFKNEHYKIARLLVANSPSIQLNVTIKGDKTALHLVCQHVQEDMMNWLLKQNAGVNMQDENGQTTLMFACEYGHEKLAMKLLEAGANPNIPDMTGRTAFMIASEKGDDNMIKLILGFYGKDHLMEQDYQVILHKACELGRFGTVSAMIDSCPSLIMVVDSIGQTMLHVACLHNKVSVVKLLLTNGVNINHKDKSGLTAFSIACDQGCKDIMKLLLDAGADVRSI